jgi:uncharacterized protein (TIGR03066 family)
MPTVRTFLTVCLLLGVAALTHAADKDQVDKKKLAGVWKVELGIYTGLTIEFTENGVYKQYATDGKGNKVVKEGTYTLSGKKLKTTLGKESDTVTVLKLTDKEMTVKSQDNMEIEFKKQP